MAIIYKIQNKLNNKVYIGQSKRTLDWRLNNDFCGHFKHALQDGWLPYHEYLNSGGQISWRYGGRS